MAAVKYHNHIEEREHLRDYSHKERPDQIVWCMHSEAVELETVALVVQHDSDSPLSRIDCMVDPT